MYEYLLENLINYNQINRNLRRTASNGLISRLNHRQLNELSLKYFGVDKEGKYTEDKEKIVAYKCPYSGRIINDCKELDLDHIISFVNNGGTVLFNCIPILGSVNSSKRADTLLKWWTEKEYFDIGRLQRLLEYMLEAYSLTFKEYTLEELEDSYAIYENNDEKIGNLLEDKREKEKIKNTKTFEDVSYQQFIINIINYLKNNNIDCTIYERKLKELENENIFKNIEDFELIEKELQKILKENLDDNRYITYSISIDINRLLKTFKTDNITEKLNQRLMFIKKILKENNKSLIDYLENLVDIEEYNLIYKDNPSKDEIEVFLNSISLTYSTKIEKFIEMLSMDEYTSYKNGKPDDKNILANNKVKFKDYEHIEGLNTLHFWSNNSDKIEQYINDRIELLLDKQYLTEEEKSKLEKLQKANKAIDNYNFTNQIISDLRIEKFIEMLSMDEYTSYKNGRPDKNNIFSMLNKIPFKDYGYIEGLNTSNFWSKNSNKIEQRINDRIGLLLEKQFLTEEETDELERLQKAQKAIDDYNFANPINSDLRIEKFIEMLSMDEYTSYKDGKPNGENILVNDNKVKFKDYGYIEGLNTSNFWSKNSDKIEQRINDRIALLLEKQFLTNEEADELERLQKANKAIDNYNFTNQFNLDLRIEKFIEMLSMDEYTSYKDGKPNDENIFATNNKVKFKDYGSIEGLNTSNFWSKNSDKIEQRINDRIGLLLEKQFLTEEETNELERLQKAQKAIDDYNFANPINSDLRIEKFIEMLGMDEYTSYKDGKPNGENILVNDNKVKFKDYGYIGGLNTSNFWGTNCNEIEQRINDRIELLLEKQFLTEEETDELERLQKANKAIDNYNFTKSINLDLRIEKFIDMLSMDEYTSYKDGKPNDENIFATNNKVEFKDYEHIEGLNTSCFWRTNHDKIEQCINDKIVSLNEKKSLTKEEIDKLGRLQKANKAIDDYNFSNQNNPDLRIKKFIEMLSYDEYTSYKDGEPDSKNNIFCKENEIPFKDYEHIEGLNTSYFWSNNSIKYIIPKLFFFDEYLDSEYDKARENVMTYLNNKRKRKEQPEFKNIYEYISTLDKSKKEVQALIELRDKKLKEKEEIIKENNELKNMQVNNKKII